MTEKTETNNRIISIAIDGPSAAGKSTLAKKIAKYLNYTYIDTGAMYRCVALNAKQNNIDFQDQENVIKLLDNIDIRLDNGKVFLNNVEVTNTIRTNELSMGASLVSQYHDVRLKMVSLQQKMAQTQNVVMDGRDIGTYVLPKADVKIFLIANVHQRADRRYKENLERNIESDKEKILQDLIKRDYQDVHRDFAPLKKADDAIVVDTSNLSITETFNTVLNIILDKISK